MRVLKTMVRLRFLLFASTMLMAPSILISTSLGDEKASKVDALFRRWDRPDSPGAAVAVIRGGVTVLAKGYGIADLEHDVPIGPRTVFHVASVSKQFTAFAIQMLAERGKLSLDDDIRKWLPEVPDFGRPISIRQLVHHTSGLRDQWDLLQMAGWRMDDVITQRQILRMVGRQRDLNFPPGSQHLYCNTGYTLLAEIVGRAGGRPFPAWMQSNVFEPLGMGRTHFHDDHERIVKGRADSYKAGPDGGYKKSVLSFANVGATSLFTTAEDLARWVANLGDPKVGGARVMAGMVEPGKLNSGATLDYASALLIDEYRGLLRVGHNGADAGYRAYLGRFPDQDLGVVVLSNLASFDPEGMAMGVAELYLGDQMTKPSRPNSPPVARTTEAFPLPPALLDDFVGSFEGREDREITIIRRVGDRLILEASPGRRRDLVPISASTFVTSRGNRRFTFERDKEGKVARLDVSMGEPAEHLISDRIQPFTPTSEDLNAYAGLYVSPELETSYRLVVGKGGLVAEHARNEAITLRPIVKDRFAGEILGEVRFLRNAEGRLSGLNATTDRVRNLRFDRRD